MSLPRPIGKRLLIKPLEEENLQEQGVFVGSSEEYMPKAEVLSISGELEECLPEKDRPQVGDVVYYIHNARQPGKVRADESDHFVVGIDQIAAIL